MCVPKFFWAHTFLEQTRLSSIKSQSKKVVVDVVVVVVVVVFVVIIIVGHKNLTLKSGQN